MSNAPPCPFPHNALGLFSTLVELALCLDEVLDHRVVLNLAKTLNFSIADHRYTYKTITLVHVYET